MGTLAVLNVTFSHDGVYRYWLARELSVDGSGTCVFVMLNPSTADETKDDRTIRRCIGFATGWGFARLEVVNLFAYRATHPEDLKRAADPIGPDNDEHLLRVAQSADLVVAAWGHHGTFRGRSAKVRTMLGKCGVAVHCLRLGKTLEPVHPLYVSASQSPELVQGTCVRSQTR